MSMIGRFVSWVASPVGGTRTAVSREMPGFHTDIHITGGKNGFIIRAVTRGYDEPDELYIAEDIDALKEMLVVAMADQRIADAR